MKKDKHGKNRDRDRDRNDRNQNYNDYHDYLKAARKIGRKKKRHGINNKIADMMSGDIRPEDIDKFEEYYDNDE